MTQRTNTPRRESDASLAETIRRRLSEVFLGGLLAGIVGGIYIAPLLFDNEELKHPNYKETARTK